MNIDIIFENQDLLAINKPSGLVVNRSVTNKEETLQDRLNEYFDLKADDLGIGDRAGIVHRLDKETSGVMLVAKNNQSFEYLQEQFKNRQVQKEYIALVHGLLVGERVVVKNKIARVGKFGKFGVVDKRSEGRESETEILRNENFSFGNTKFIEIVELGAFNKPRQKYLEKNATQYTLIQAFPKTGRTHQIRVHLKSIGHPIVGDTIYLPNKLLKFDLLWCPRLFLHAAKIAFLDSQTKKRVEVTVEMPADLEEALLSLTASQ